MAPPLPPYPPAMPAPTRPARLWMKVQSVRLATPSFSNPPPPPPSPGPSPRLPPPLPARLLMKLTRLSVTVPEFSRPPPAPPNPPGPCAAARPSSARFTLNVTSVKVASPSFSKPPHSPPERSPLVEEPSPARLPRNRTLSKVATAPNSTCPRRCRRSHRPHRRRDSVERSRERVSLHPRYPTHPRNLHHCPHDCGGTSRCSGSPYRC